MSKLRTGIWILVLIFLMLLFFQNQGMFLNQRSLRLNLYFTSYQTPELYEGLFFLAALLIGYLIAYLLSLGDRFKARRIIKQLASANDSQRQEIATLRNEIQEMKRVSAPQPPLVTTAVQPPAERIDYEKPPMGGPSAEALNEQNPPVEPEKTKDIEKK